MLERGRVRGFVADQTPGASIYPRKLVEPFPTPDLQDSPHAWHNKVTAGRGCCSFEDDPLHLSPLDCRSLSVPQDVRTLRKRIRQTLIAFNKC